MVPVVYKNDQELQKLLSFLKERGYTGYAENFRPFVVCVRPFERTYSWTNVTVMACWCSGKRYPLNVDQFMEYYERIVIGNDFDLYEKPVTENRNI